MASLGCLAIRHVDPMLCLPSSHSTWRECGTWCGIAALDTMRLYIADFALRTYLSISPSSLGTEAGSYLSLHVASPIC